MTNEAIRHNHKRFEQKPKTRGIRKLRFVHVVPAIPLNKTKSFEQFRNVYF